VTVELFPSKSAARCVVCADALDAGARKCVRCGSFQDGVNCISCGLAIPAAAMTCTSCKTLQAGDHCRACGATIAAKSRRCPECSSWQNWRRLFAGLEVSLALILAFFSVIGAAVPVVLGYLTNSSETYVRVLGTRQYGEEGQGKETTIAVLAVNNGKRMSFINSASIAFPGMDVWPARLRIRNLGDQAVPPGRNVILYFTGSPKTRNGKSTEDVTAQAKSGKVRIVVNIDESGRDGKVVPAVQQQLVPATLLYDWISNHVAKPAH
jgi:predicted nucleic acid-binding Zn ribbon protein